MLLDLVLPLVDYSTSLYLNFFICAMGILKVLMPRGFCLNELICIILYVTDLFSIAYFKNFAKNSEFN